MSKKPAPKENYHSLRDWIGDLESGNRYDVLHGGDTVDLTGMTIAEVKELQRERIANGDQSAAGKYQIINKTIEDLQKRKPSWFKDDRLFDEETQDLMADVLIDDRVRRAKKSDGDLTDNLVNELAKEWAGLPTLAGVSNYEGIAGNKALTSVDDAKAVVGDFVSKTRPKLKEVKVTAKKRKPPLEEVEVTAKRRPELKPQDIPPPKIRAGDPRFEFPPLEEIVVDAKKRRVPIGIAIREIVVDAKKRNIDPADWLKEIQVTAQKRKGLEPPPLEPVEVTAQKRKGIRPPPPELIMGDPSIGNPPIDEIEVTAQRRPTPTINPPLEPVEVTAERRKGIRPPSPELIMGDPKFDVPPLEPVEVTAKKKQMPNEFLKEVEVTARKKSKNGKQLKVTVTPKKESEAIEISPELLKEALSVDEEKGVRRREYIDGIANSAFEGATLGFGDEARALAESMVTGEEYERIRDRYLTKKDKFDAANPGASMVAELVPALLTGVPIVKAGAKLAPKINPKTVVDDKWLPKAPGIGATAGLEGAVYNAGSVDSGWEERADAAFTGGATGYFAGATLGRVIQAGQSRVARNVGDDLDDEVYMEQKIVPGERVIYRTNDGKMKRVEVVEEVDTTPKYENAPFLDVPKQGRVIVRMENGTEFAVDRAKVEKINVTDFNKKAQEINFESQAKTFAENADPSFIGPRQNKLEIIEKFDNARGQNQNIKSWREAENAGELWDGLKKGVTDFYDDYISPASDMLMRRVSPQVGALFQRSDETALRTTVREAKAFYDPIDPVVKLEMKDPVFHAMVINYAAGNSLRKGQRVSQQDIVSYVKSAIGDDAAKAVDRYLVYSRKKNQVNNSRVRGGKERLDRLGNYLHTKLNPKKKPGKNTEELDDFDYLKDAADESRTRGFITPEMADNYLPVFATDFRRIMNNERLLELAKKFDMPLPPPGTSARDFFQLFENWLVTRGVSREAAQQAKEVIAESMVGQTRSPMGWLQGANSLAYLGTLAGPKSAVLNIHDPLVTTANLGLKAGRNMFSSRGFKPRQAGIDQNVGEFMNTYNDILNMDGRSLERLFADTARNWTDIGMKASGFAAMDELGKMGTLNVVLQHAVDQARAGKLADSWGFYFSKSELKKIESALKKHGTDTAYYGEATDLIEELAFAGLGQQQLISGAGRPTGWARNPNMRPLWALRGFAIKQQALAMRNILGNIQDGNTAEAMKWLTRYALIAGGSYGLINEARQWLMGDGEASITGVLMGMADQMVSLASLNTIGLNDYQYGRIMEEGIITTFIKGLEPIITARPRQFGEDVVKAMTDENTPASYPFTQFPIPKQVGNAMTNIQENVLNPIGVLPGVDPLERVMKPITTEGQ